MQLNKNKNKIKGFIGMLKFFKVKTNNIKLKIFIHK